MQYGERSSRRIESVGVGRQNVLGKTQHHRPWAPRQRHVIGVRDEFGDALGRAHDTNPLGYSAKEARKVDLLE